MQVLHFVRLPHTLKVPHTIQYLHTVYFLYLKYYLIIFLSVLKFSHRGCILCAHMWVLQY
jgi:hypothetical protein